MPSDSSKKRSRPTTEEEELEIDVNASEPLSKRAARRLKKGRSLKQAPSAASLPDSFQEPEEPEEDADEGAKDEEANVEPSKKKSSTKSKNVESKEYVKGTNGIWIANLSFRTTEADLITFFTTVRPLGKARPTSSYHVILPADIVRISMPTTEKGNKGFAYVDFSTPEAQETAMGLTERILGGRNVLIKAANNFEGRPTTNKEGDKKKEAEEGTKILYVGNLSFDVTSEDLEKYLGGTEAGIKKVRMATFEDSGKCKGFAFVDFTEVDHVRKILKDKKLHNMNGRKLKMEFGQDRSLRRKPPTHSGTNGSNGGGRLAKVEGKVDPRTIKPGQALMDAPRASHAIVASKGQKVSFD